MFRSIIAGIVIGYLLTFFDVNLWFAETVQPYLTFTVTDTVYYVVFAILGCIFIKS